jgi:hypothetical protein
MHLTMSLTTALSTLSALPTPTIGFAPFSYQGGAYKTWYTVYGNLKSNQAPLLVLLSENEQNACGCDGLLISADVKR